MKSHIVLPVILLWSMSRCFAFPKPLPQKVNIEVQLPIHNLIVGGGHLDFAEMPTKNNPNELKKEDKYIELLNMGLARKKKKNRNA